MPAHWNGCGRKATASAKKDYGLCWCIFLPNINTDLELSPRLYSAVKQYKTVENTHTQLVLKQPMCLHGLQPVAVLFECSRYCSMLVFVSIQYYCNTNVKQGCYSYYKMIE